MWAKVKAFFDHLGHQIKEFFDNLGKQIKEFFEKIFSKEVRDKIVAALKKFWTKVVAKFDEIFGKYKDLIISALTKDGKVILEVSIALFFVSYFSLFFVIFLFIFNLSFKIPRVKKKNIYIYEYHKRA